MDVTYMLSTLPMLLAVLILFFIYHTHLTKLENSVKELENSIKEIKKHEEEKNGN